MPSIASPTGPGPAKSSASPAPACCAGSAPRAAAAHPLSRLASGPRPGEMERVARAGVLRWIDAQLAPDKIDDDTVARREREFDVLKPDRGDLARLYAAVPRARQERKRMGDTTADQRDASPVAVKGRRF